MENEFEIAKIIQFNAEAEAKAVKDYTDMLQKVNFSDIIIEQKELIIETIKELIADELNHENKLQELYVYLTNIEPKKD